MKPDWRYVVLSGVVLVVLGALAWQKIIHGDALLTFIAGAVIPMLRSSTNEPK